MTRFFTQPNKKYRNFQLVYTVLTLNFLIPAFSYLLAPDVAINQIHQMTEMMGAEAYTANESGHFWRFLAFSDVLTLGFICLILQVNLRRWYPALLPLLVCKGSSVVASAYVFFFQYNHPFFISPVILDTVTCLAIWYFATRARRALVDGQDDQLVPRPRFAEGTS